jgi:hypothetical protein
VLSGGDSYCRWSVADEAAVYFDVGTVGSGGDLDASLIGGCRVAGVPCCSGRWGWRGLEFGRVELHVSADVGGDFGAFGDGDVLAVHEEEEGRGGKKYQAAGDDASVMAPVWPPPLTSGGEKRARSFDFARDDKGRRTLGRLTFLEPRTYPPTQPRQIGILARFRSLCPWRYSFIIL